MAQTAPKKYQIADDVSENEDVEAVHAVLLHKCECVRVPVEANLEFVASGGELSLIRRTREKQSEKNLNKFKVNFNAKKRGEKMKCEEPARDTR